MKRLFAFMMVLIMGCLSMVSCSFDNAYSSKNYNKEWMIGKTSSEIEIKYGEFDICLNEEKIGSNYCNTGCGYLTKKQENGVFGTKSDEFIMIYFDENGKAYKIVEDYPRPGG